MLRSLYQTISYETADSLHKRLAGMYAKATVETVEAMACFTCKKGYDESDGTEDKARSIQLPKQNTKFRT